MKKWPDTIGDFGLPWVVEKDDIAYFGNTLRQLAKLFPDEPLHILEWGAGGSCHYYPRFMRDVGIEYVWHSIEHDSKVKHEILGPKLGGYTFIIECPFPLKIEWDERLAGKNLEYVRMAERLRPPNGFHLIYVDGYYRYSCLVAAQKLLHKDGILLMDNADRADPKHLDTLAFDGEFIKPHLWKAKLRSK